MLHGTMASAAKHDGLFCEFYWGSTRNEVRSIKPEQQQVFAAPDETVTLPLYGFTLPQEPFLLAERTAQGYRVFIPPATRVERSRRQDAFRAVPEAELRGAGAWPWVELAPDERLRLSQGELALLLTHSVAGRSEGLKLKDLGWLWMLIALVLSLPVGLYFAGYSREHMAESAARALEAQKENERAERKRLGVDTPAHPLPPARAPATDAGVKPLPGSIGVH